MTARNRGHKEVPLGESTIHNFYPVILAGGRGTRFWPLSRKRRAKQLLPLNGTKSMIQETVERLEPVAPAQRFWIITNQDLREPILQQLPALNANQVLAEPVGRNTAPAIGLAAFLLERQDPDAVIGMFPSDHVIQDEAAFRANVQSAVKIAGSGAEHCGDGNSADPRGDGIRIYRGGAEIGGRRSAGTRIH